MILWIFFSVNHLEVSKSKSQIQKAGEATAKSTRAVCSAILQWNDAKHPRIQRVARLPTLSTPQFNQPLSSSNKFITEYIIKTLLNCFLWILQDLFQMGSSAYPTMTQPFSMSQGSMGSVGVRQDSMSKIFNANFLSVDPIQNKIN